MGRAVPPRIVGVSGMFPLRVMAGGPRDQTVTTRRLF
jgi:hypothetical protein